MNKLASSSGRSLSGCLVLFAVLGAPTSAFGGPPLLEKQKLVAGDGANSAYFGYSLDLSGTYAVVGARLDSSQGMYSGAAYIFERDSLGAWSEAQKLVAPNGNAGDFFGQAVSISGSTAVVGAYLAFGFAGTAWVFDRDLNGIWSATVRIDSPDSGAGTGGFGSSVAISGSTLIVGASGSKAAYVFDRNVTGDWIFKQKLTAPGGAQGTNFGSCVAVHQDLAAVGAPTDSTVGSLAGAAYVFTRQPNGIWTVATPLVAPDIAAGDTFGTSVAIVETGVLVGSPVLVSNPMKPGSAYLFGTDPGGAWVQKQKVTASDASNGDWFGRSIAVSDAAGIVGARSAAYLLRRDSGGIWNESQRLISQNTSSNSEFGNSVALEGEVALVGAPADAVGEGFDVGAAFVFTPCSTNASATNYGIGKPGFYGIPQLQSAAPEIGSTTSLTISNAFPGLGILFVGFQQAAYPFDGGQLLLDPLTQFTFIVPFVGNASIPISIPVDGIVCGLPVYFQVFTIDAAAAGALHTAQTPGLRWIIGQ